MPIEAVPIARFPRFRVLVDAGGPQGRARLSERRSCGGHCPGRRCRAPAASLDARETPNLAGLQEVRGDRVVQPRWLAWRNTNCGAAADRQSPSTVSPHRLSSSFYCIVHPGIRVGARIPRRLGSTDSVTPRPTCGWKKLCRIRGCGELNSLQNCSSNRVSVIDLFQITCPNFTSNVSRW